MPSYLRRFRSVHPVLAVASLAVSLAIFPFALDISLAARYTVLAAVLTAFALWALFRARTSALRLDAVVLIYFLFALVYVLSIGWSENKAEAIFSAGRTVLGFSVFSGTVFLADHSRFNFGRTIFFSSLMLAIVLLVIGVLELPQADLSNRDSLYNISGLHGHKNLLCSLLFLNLGILLFTLPGKGALRPAGIIVACMILAFIILLQSRAVALALLTVAASLPVLMFLTRRRKSGRPVLHILIILALSNFIFLWVFPNALEHMLPGASAGSIADEERFRLWQKSFAMFREHPFTGVGAGNWQIFFPALGLAGIWRADELNFSFQRPHNDFLWILTETGIIGFNLFLLMLILAGYYTVRHLRTTTTAIRRRLCIALSFLLGFLFIAWSDFPFERTEHVFWFNISLAFIYVHGSRKQLPALITVKSPAKIFAAAAAAFMVLCIVGAFRLKGEYYTRILYNYRDVSMPAPIIASADKAGSVFYNLDPTSVPLAWYSGSARIQMGDLPGALQDFEKAFKYHPFNRNVLNDLASSYSMAGNSFMAKTFYARAAEISPRFDEPRLNLVAILIQEQNFREAAEWLSTLVHDSERRSQYQAIVDAALSSQ